MHNVIVIECDDRRGTNRAIRNALEFREELEEYLIGDTRQTMKAIRPPQNEELRLTNVGVHKPEMLTDRGNCAICSKKIRKSFNDQYKDIPKARRPALPHVPCPSVFCSVCNVYLRLQKEQNCCRDYTEPC